MLAPRVSVIVPAAPSAAGLTATLASLRCQGDVPVEVLVQPVGPWAAAPAIPDLPASAVVHRGGPAEDVVAAVSAGQRAARGEWLAWLQPGERLQPGALGRVLAAAGSGALVSGRCALVDGTGAPTGLELPWPFGGVFQHVAFWQRGFHALPPAATFWPRSLAAQLGDLAPADAPAPFYALMCRYTRVRPVHALDALLAETRALVSVVDGPEAFAAHLAVSRRHWGGQRWRYALSLARHQARLHERARRHVARARDPWLGGRARLASGLVASALAPRLAARSLLATPLQEWVAGLWERRPPAGGGGYLLGAREPYADRWVGPRLRRVFRRVGRARRLVLSGDHKHPHAADVPLELELRLEGRLIGHHRVEGPGAFTLELPLPHGRVGPLCLDLLAGPTFVPDELLGGGDRRELSFRLQGLELRS